MTTVSDRTMIGEDVRVDDHSFVNCRFQDCRLFYAGGFFGLQDTTIARSSWIFDGAAQRTINLLVLFQVDLSQLQAPPADDEMPN